MRRETLGMLRTIYPTHRSISIAETIAWAHDEMVNRAVDEWVKQHGLIPDGSTGDSVWMAIRGGVPKPSLLDAVEYLEDIGVATFARQSHEAAS